MELVSIEENKNNIVVKHQELVHNARYRLSELGIKVLSVLISMIKTSDTEFTQYAIKIEDFKELIHSDSKNTYKYAHKLISELMSNPMQLGDEQFNWTSYGKYRKGEGIIVFEVHRLLKPYLMELKKDFLQYNITNILPLKSGYVIRLYELCKDHYSEGTRYKKTTPSVTFDIKIDRLRELFEIPDSYQYSSHIKKNILTKGVEQFRDKTDIQISYKEQKIGRKVDRIVITVKANNKGSNDYLNHRQAFIKHMRANYINQDIIRTTDKYTGKNLAISVAQDGRLYDKKGAEFDAERSNEMWDTLFQMAKDGTLQCLNQDTLFNEDIEQISTGVQEKHAEVVAIEELELDDKFINFAKSTNLTDEEIEMEFLRFNNYHRSEGTEPNSEWFKLWCGWISNSNKLFR